MMPLGRNDSNILDENNRLLHSPDDVNKGGNTINDIETMNNLNTCGPQCEESQPVISETKGKKTAFHIVFL